MAAVGTGPVPSGAATGMSVGSSGTGGGVSVALLSLTSPGVLDSAVCGILSPVTPLNLTMISVVNPKCRSVYAKIVSTTGAMVVAIVLSGMRTVGEALL